MQWSYIIVQAPSSERLQGFNLRPSLPPRQGLTPPLPPWRGLWPSRIRHSLGLSSTLPPSCRHQSHKLSRAEVRWRHRRGWQWGGGEYMAKSQPIVYTLSHSVNHSVTTSHTLPPILTYLFIFYTPTHWLSSSHLFFFSFFVHSCLQTHISASFLTTAV